ncbi:arp2/3 complex-activating protein rickA-like [Colius striatus]|uniref:arp2/3 complex-activating protein rickA-like n=1 Tax=Colius striatus TaxID=57412 RepID=UPI002B1E5E43|nr:arp2/3 complex-activating protein rickA-like [Colius striatus]
MQLPGPGTGAPGPPSPTCSDGTQPGASPHYRPLLIVLLLPPPPHSPQLSGSSIHLGPGQPPPPPYPLRCRPYANGAPPTHTNGGRPAPATQACSENSALRRSYTPHPHAMKGSRQLVLRMFADFIVGIKNW